MAAKAKALKLQVANAKPEDSGRSLARLSRAFMAANGILQGDVVQLTGKRMTAAMGWNWCGSMACNAPMQGWERANWSRWPRRNRNLPRVLSLLRHKRICDCKGLSRRYIVAFWDGR
jgi:Cell division protein 48 (CDC48), N-terminal domain